MLDADTQSAVNSLCGPARTDTTPAPAIDTAPGVAAPGKAPAPRPLIANRVIATTSRQPPVDGQTVLNVKSRFEPDLTVRQAGFWVYHTALLNVRGAKAMNNIEVVNAFMNAINAHDVDTLSKLMTENHVFTDSLGSSVTGRDQMIAGWKHYFVFCPDYWVAHEEFLEEDRLVAVFGSAGGTVAAEGYTSD